MVEVDSLMLQRHVVGGGTLKRFPTRHVCLSAEKGSNFVFRCVCGVQETNSLGRGLLFCF